MFMVISVIYRPVEQLLSRTIADRRARRAPRPPAARAARASRPASRRFLVAALALRDPIEDGCSTAPRRCTGCSSAATLAYAASYFARGWLAGHQWFGLYGGLVLMSRSRASVPARVAIGIASGQTAVALGIVAAPSSRWSSSRRVRAPRAPGPRRGRRSRPSGARRRRCRCARRRLRGRRAAIMLAEQTLLNAAVLRRRDLRRAPPGSSSTRCSSRARRCSSSRRSRPRCCRTSPASRRPRATTRSRAPIRITILGDRRLRGAPWRSGCCCSARGPWSSSSARTTHYGRVGLARRSPLGMGCHLAPARSTRRRWPAAAPAAAAALARRRRAVRRLDAGRSSTTSCCARRSATRRRPAALRGVLWDLGGFGGAAEARS